MAEYRIQYDRSSKKFLCPQCGHRTFVRYHDKILKQYLPPRFEDRGKCDRQDNCGYERRFDFEDWKSYMQEIGEWKENRGGRNNDYVVNEYKPRNSSFETFRNKGREKQGKKKRRPLFVSRDLLLRSSVKEGDVGSEILFGFKKKDFYICNEWVLPYPEVQEKQTCNTSGLLVSTEGEQNPAPLRDRGIEVGKETKLVEVNKPEAMGGEIELAKESEKEHSSLKSLGIEPEEAFVMGAPIESSIRPLDVVRENFIDGKSYSEIFRCSKQVLKRNDLLNFIEGKVNKLREGFIESVSILKSTKEIEWYKEVLQECPFDVFELYRVGVEPKVWYLSEDPNEMNQDPYRDNRKMGLKARQGGERVGFPYVSPDGKIYGVMFIPYNKETGKRTKKEFPNGFAFDNTWIHVLLRGVYKNHSCEKVFPWLTDYLSDEGGKMEVLFGSHIPFFLESRKAFNLETIKPGSVVNIGVVEAPKTALIASVNTFVSKAYSFLEEGNKDILEPVSIEGEKPVTWMATGGRGMFSFWRLKKVADAIGKKYGAKVRFVCVPDRSKGGVCFKEWEKKAELFSNESEQKLYRKSETDFHFEVVVSDCLERNIHEDLISTSFVEGGDGSCGYDLGDYILDAWNHVYEKREPVF